MPYGRRLAVILLLLAAGFAMQAVSGFLILPGAFLLLCASLLGIVRGYTNKPEKLGADEQWRAADKAQLQKILDIAESTKKWDRSFLDITCPRGLFALFVLLGGAGFLGFSLIGLGFINAGFALCIDVFVLFLPHWVTGVRTILVNAPLTVKIENLLYVWSLWEASRREGENMSAQMAVVKAENGELPADAKLILQYPALGESFFGLQVQVVLNNVQGTDYPYLYCVLVAKKEFGMGNKLKLIYEDAAKFIKAENKAAGFFSVKPCAIDTEIKDEGGMQILVIRQRTTKDSGYYTDRKAIERLFRFAREAAQRLS